MKQLFTKWLLILLMTTITICVSSLKAQNNQNQDGEWTFSIGQSLLVPIQLQSDVTALGITQRFTLSTSDFFSFDDVFTGLWHFDARYKKIGIFTDLSYTYAEDSNRIQNYPLPPVLAQIINARINPSIQIPPGTPADAVIGTFGSALTIDIGGMYRILEGVLSQSSNITYFIEPYIAARISVLKSELDFELDLASIPVVRTIADNTEEVFKTIFGFKFRVATDGNWTSNLQTGFGSSLFQPQNHMSFRFSQEVAYSPRELLYLSLGYHYRYLDFENNNVGLSQSQHAISLGIRVGF